MVRILNPAAYRPESLRNRLPDSQVIRYGKICSERSEEHDDIFLVNPFPDEPHPALTVKRFREVIVKGFGECAKMAGKEFLHERIPLGLSLQIIEFFCILLVQRKPRGEEFIGQDFIRDTKFFISDLPDPGPR